MTRRSSPWSLSAALLFFNAAWAALPQVDFDRMGKVGLGGSFSGLGLFDSNTAGFDPSTATLLSRDSKGALSRLASTNAGGQITSGCVLDDVFYLAGTFSSIGGISASNVASYTRSSNTFSALGSNGPSGGVQAVYCDQKESQLWVGGRFTSPGPSVAVWDPKASLWSKAPFGGLSGAGGQVNSITSNSSHESIVFAGSFITTFQSNGTVSNLNGTNNPNVPFSAGATPFSSSLVPVPLGGKGTEINGSPSSLDSQFSDIQKILCPSGPDGPGNTWLAADGNAAVITARTFTFITGSGIRLGNTFQSGHGTTGFTVTTIPDNAVRQLRYVDPKTGQNNTCTDPCPLLTDPSILYQDFLFDDPISITGVLVKLSQYTGSGPGLHIFQVLSSGAFASALEDQNTASCFAPNPSNTTRTGSWTEKVADTNIPGTTQSVLVSSVDVGTPAAQGPSFTWIPYVSASGQYDINLLVPGCTNFQDCAQRTSVKVTVFPGSGIEPWVSTISQQNPDDSTTLVYSGPIVPSSPDFVTTVFMTLADNPTGLGQAGKYELVADRIQMVLKSANVSSNGGAGGNGSTGAQGVKSGFGFFEWPLGSSSSSMDATQILPTATQTFIDAVGFDIFQGVGGSSSLTSSSIFINAVAHHPSGAIYIGGQFTLSTGATNMVIFKGGSLSALTDHGLDGPVTSLVLDGDKLFVGGTFRDTPSSTTQGRLSGVAMYDIQQNQWFGLGAGVNGGVTSLGFCDGKIQVAGNFTKLLTSPGSNSGVEASGLATWDVGAGAWVNSGGFIVGSVSFVGNGTSPQKGEKFNQFVAGNIRTSLKIGTSGMVMLSNGNGRASEPQVTALGVQLDNDVGAVKSSAHQRRAYNRRGPRAWIPSLKISGLFSRQSPSQLIPLPVAPPSPAPAVLAGAFWTNSSTSREVVIIGGNFSFTTRSSESQGVGIYDPTSTTITPLHGSQVNGTVRSLLAVGDMLYVGGQFTLGGTDVNGLAIYDLAKQKWDVSGLQPLQPISGTIVVVRSITASSSKPNAVIVAGSFAQAGSLRCQSICSWDTSTKQWNSLGDGIQGEVASTAYAGNNQDVLIASGSIAVDKSITNVAKFSFANGTWSAVGAGGELPGTVTAVEVNSGNVSSIFAAGRSNDGSSPFLSYWNGISWTALSSTLQGASNIAQLTMVPLQDTHNVNGIIQPDRMLMISGSLADPSFGNASTVLFDGQTLIPYITSMSSSGTAGVISSMFHSFSTFSFTQHHFLATGVVILISIAIGAGVVFFLALIGILWTLFSRRDDKINKFDPAGDDDDDSTHHRPSSLLEHINAATRTTILGSTSPFGNDDEKDGDVKGALAVSTESDPFGPDAGGFARAETPSDAMGGVLGDEDMSRPAHARYSFDGTGEGELPLTSGQEVEVLDDRDPAWWYARNQQTGQEGVVPAAYLY